MPGHNGKDLAWPAKIEKQIAELEASVQKLAEMTADLYKRFNDELKKYEASRSGSIREAMPASGSLRDRVSDSLRDMVDQSPYVGG